MQEFFKAHDSIRPVAGCCQAGRAFVASSNSLTIGHGSPEAPMPENSEASNWTNEVPQNMERLKVTRSAASSSRITEADPPAFECSVPFWFGTVWYFSQQGACCPQLYYVEVHSPRTGHVRKTTKWRSIHGLGIRSGQRSKEASLDVSQAPGQRGREPQLFEGVGSNGCPFTGCTMPSPLVQNI